MNRHRSGLPFVVGLGAFLTACAPITEVRRDTVRSTDTVRVRSVRTPQFDHRAFRSYVDDRAAVVQVQWEPACRVLDREVRVVDRETLRVANPYVLTAETVVGVVGGIALAKYGFRQGDATLGWSGVVLLGAGLAAPIADAEAARDESERGVRVLGPVTPERVAPCSEADVRQLLVSLVMPRMTLTAYPNRNGVARFPINEAFWTSVGESVEAEIGFDGVMVGRTRLVRMEK